MPASLGPGLRTVSGAKRRRGGLLPSRAILCHASEELPAEPAKPSSPSRSRRALPIAKWAKNHNVPRRTAYRWASEPKVRAEVERARRRALDRAVGRMSDRATWAAKNIVKLGETAASESVRLAALRAILSDMMAVSKFGTLEDRMTQIEEQLHHAGTRSTGCAG